MQKIRDRIVYYQFLSFQKYCPELRHLLTTRMSGFSKKPYDSLNIGLHVGDKRDDVIRNRELVCQTLGSNIDSMVAMQQSHSANVKVIDERYMGLGQTAEAFNYMKQLRDYCSLFGGDFVILWHNDRFINNLEREIYQALIN